MRKVLVIFVLVSILPLVGCRRYAEIKRQKSQTNINRNESRKPLLSRLNGKYSRTIPVIVGDIATGYNLTFRFFESGEASFATTPLPTAAEIQLDGINAIGDAKYVIIVEDDIDYILITFKDKVPPRVQGNIMKLKLQKNLEIEDFKKVPEGTSIPG